MIVPQVTTDQTCDFAEKWRMGGVYVQLPPAAIQFATDWANIVMASWIEQQVKKLQAKRAAEEAAAAPKIVLAGE
jgi:hypothetical protein